MFVDRRRVVADSMVDDIHVTNYGCSERHVVVELFAASDLAHIFVKHGRAMAPAQIVGVADRRRQWWAAVRGSPGRS